MENNNRQGCRWTKEEQEKLWDEVEDIFDKHTSPTGGGYEADYTYKGGFISELKEKYLIAPIEPCATSSPHEKDLIIHGLEEGSQQWKEEYDSARKIIEQLVEQSGILYTYGSRIEGIYQKFPELLKSAKEFLSKYQHQ